MTETLQPPASPIAIISVLEDSLAELRSLEKMLFDNGQREAAVFLSQVKLIVTKVEHGIVVGRSDLLSLLEAATRLSQGRN